MTAIRQVSTNAYHASTNDQVVASIDSELRNALDKITTIKARRERALADAAQADRDITAMKTELRNIHARARTSIEPGARRSIELINRISQAIASTFRV